MFRKNLLVFVAVVSVGMLNCETEEPEPFHGIEIISPKDGEILDISDLVEQNDGDSLLPIICKCNFADFSDGYGARVSKDSGSKDWMPGPALRSHGDSIIFDTLYYKFGWLNKMLFDRGFLIRVTNYSKDWVDETEMFFFKK
jgi:hypothetical protein